MNDHVPSGDLAQRLHECETRLRATFEEAPVGMGHLDVHGCWRRVNRRLAAILQGPEAAWQGRRLIEALHPEDAAAVTAELASLLQGATARMDIEARVVTEQGPTWCRLSAALCGAPDDMSRFVTCMVEDISGRRRTDERMRYLAAIVDSTDDAVIGKDLSGTITSWNPGAERVYGYTQDEVVGKPIQMLAPPELHDEIPSLLERIRSGSRVDHYQTVRRRKDGRQIHVSLTISPVQDLHGNIIGASTISRDISHQVQNMADMQRSAILLDKVFSAVRVLLAYMDRDFNFIKVNRAYAAADGHEPEYFVGKNHFALYPNAENEAMFRLAIETGQPAYVAERPFAYAGHPERGTSYWDWVVQPVTGTTGAVEGLVLSLLDVTEKVKVRKELEATAAYSRSLIEANLDPLVTIGKDGRITDVNHATETVTGRARAQLIGTDFSDYFTQPDKARRGYRAVFEKGFVRDYPLEIRHVDGHVTPVLYNASVYRDASGEVVGVFAAARDITERRAAEAAIHKSEARLRQAQRIARIGSWELDLVTNVLIWSDEIYNIFEIDKRRFGASYEAFLAAIHPDDRAAVNQAYTRSVETRTPYSIDHRLLFPDGRVKYVHEQCETFYDDGRALRSIGTVQDITDRKHVEKLLELRTREQEAIASLGYRALAGGSLDALTDEAARLVAETLDVEYSKVLELMPDRTHLLLRAGVGWAPGRVGKELVSAGRESQAGFTLLAQEPVVVPDFPHETRFSGPALLSDHHVQSGVSVIIGEHAHPYGVLGAYTSRAREFTREDINFLQAVANVIATAVERAHAEKAARLANAYNRSLIEASLDPLATIGRDGKITDVSAATEAVTGRSRTDLIGTDFADYFTEPQAAKAGYRRAFEQGFVRDYPLEIRHADGHSTPVLYNASVYRGEGGEVLGIFAAARDITERKQAEEALRRANAYNRRLIEASLDPLVTIGKDGSITDVNAATEMVTGRSRDELIGTDFADYFTDPTAAKAGYRRAFEQGFVRDYPLEIRHADAHTTPVLYNASVYRDETGEVIGIFAAARDITERKQAEKSLRQANAYNRRLIEASLDPMVTIGKDGTITDVNAATEAVTGRSREQLIDTDFSDYFTEPERARAGYRQVFEKGFVVDYPLEIRHADSHVTPVLYNASVYRDESGEVVGVFAAARDITERKKAEQEVLRLGRRNELLLQSAGEGIYGLDTNGNCTFVNPAAATMLGYTPAELVGRPLHDVIHYARPDGSPYPIAECTVQKAYTEARVFRGTDEVYWRRDGSYFPIEYVSTPILEEGRVLGAVVGFLDITERKQAEEALRRLNRELDERVKARTAELEAANKELESFSYSVSHDLRTPLRAIDGFSRILLSDYESRLDEDGKRLLKIVRENTEKMAQLISDILAFSRTSRAGLTKMPVDMQALTREVWEEVHQLEPGRSFDFRMEALPNAYGDRALLRQVLANLLSNAAKFTRGKAPARIDVGFEENASEIVYHVHDNGVGFDMRYVDRLFGVFQRLHSASDFEGTGIGLAVVKRIVARHGGRVWAESRAGEGATFYVALPKPEADHG